MLFCGHVCGEIMLILSPVGWEDLPIVGGTGSLGRDLASLWWWTGNLGQRAKMNPFYLKLLLPGILPQPQKRKLGYPFMIYKAGALQSGKHLPIFESSRDERSHLWIQPPYLRNWSVMERSRYKHKGSKNVTTHLYPFGHLKKNKKWSFLKLSVVFDDDIIT